MDLKGGDILQVALAKYADSLGVTVKVGFLEGATYPATEDNSEPLSVAQVAFWNEFGTSKIPARPFMRYTIASKSSEWVSRFAKAISYANGDAKTAAALVGESMTDDIKESIINWQDPPNAAYTIEQKGFNKPLIHTGHMKDSVSYEVGD